MPSLKVTHNSSHHATVSLEGKPGVLSCIINSMNRDCDGELEEEYHTSFGGIDNTSGDYVDWERMDLKVGDLVVIEIVEESVASPKPLRRPYEEHVAHCKKEQTRALVKELGWTIIEESPD